MSTSLPQDLNEVLLLKHGELVLKGLNRRIFEKVLEKNLSAALKDAGECVIKTLQSTITLTPGADFDMDKAAEKVSKVFGLSGYSRACVAEKDFEKICEMSARYLHKELSSAKTFKVAAKRSDKSFEFSSPEICARLGEYLLGKFDGLKVDVHTPELVVVVEVREVVYIHSAQKQTIGGMPVGTAGHAMLLLSGGIDSPVAGFMMAKRGLKISGVHFESPPYTSPRAKNKVVTLFEKLRDYIGESVLYTVPFTKIQEEIAKNAPEEYATILMRRYMMKIASKLADIHGGEALITGESLGQVASQTVSALACTDAASNVPVFRPLIGMDKQDIVEISKKIDTYDTSILPFDDCCTVFTPKRPCIHPKIEKVLKIEESLNLDELVENAIGEVSAEYI